ncbi:MAG: hypothetical protein MI757_09335 [Pirellulales bacterium]|nr:hypothetical protein [Pirellulales bacterium]
MPEPWLLANRRAVAMGMVVPALIGVVGLILATGVVESWSFMWLRLVGGFIVVLAVFVLVAMCQQIRRPRIAYDDGNLLVYLALSSPFAVPLEHVECFLLGQGPAYLPGQESDGSEVVTVVVRLAEKATDYARRDVKPALGSWCDGHITIRGTWCEPLDENVVKRLNRKLAETNRKRKAAE